MRLSSDRTIISNNSGEAITGYLTDHRLTDYIKAVVARDDHDQERMKPSPYRVREAVGMLGGEVGECAFIGDTTTDVLAGHLAGMPVKSSVPSGPAARSATPSSGSSPRTSKRKGRCPGEA